MNYFLDEQTAEYNRQRIRDEFKQIRLEQIVTKSRVYHPSRFGQMMFNFANWMISTGKQLRQRYEIPPVDCSKSPTKGFAH
jgi:hypothetical protein